MDVTRQSAAAAGECLEMASTLHEVAHRFQDDTPVRMFTQAAADALYEAYELLSAVTLASSRAEAAVLVREAHLAMRRARTLQLEVIEYF